MKVSVRGFILLKSAEKMKVWYTQLRWSTIFAENASDQLKRILHCCGIDISLETIISV